MFAHAICATPLFFALAAVLCTHGRFYGVLRVRNNVGRVGDGMFLLPSSAGENVLTIRTSNLWEPTTAPRMSFFRDSTSTTFTKDAPRCDNTSRRKDSRPTELQALALCDNQSNLWIKDISSSRLVIEFIPATKRPRGTTNLTVGVELASHPSSRS